MYIVAQSALGTVDLLEGTSLESLIGDATFRF